MPVFSSSACSALAVLSVSLPTLYQHPLYPISTSANDLFASVPFRTLAWSATRDLFRRHCRSFLSNKTKNDQIFVTGLEWELFNSSITAFNCLIFPCSRAEEEADKYIWQDEGDFVGEKLMDEYDAPSAGVCVELLISWKAFPNLILVALSTI